MRFSELTAVFADPPRVMKRELAAVYVGGPEALKELEAAGMVEPVRRTKRSAAYDRKDLDAAIDRARADGWPVGE